MEVAVGLGWDGEDISISFGTLKNKELEFGCLEALGMLILLDLQGLGRILATVCTHILCSALWPYPSSDWGPFLGLRLGPT